MTKKFKKRDDTNESWLENTAAIRSSFFLEIYYSGIVPERKTTTTSRVVRDILRTDDNEMIDRLQIALSNNVLISEDEGQVEVNTTMLPPEYKDFDNIEAYIIATLVQIINPQAKYLKEDIMLSDWVSTLPTKEERFKRLETKYNGGKGLIQYEEQQEYKEYVLECGERKDKIEAAKADWKKLKKRKLLLVNQMNKEIRMAALNVKRAIAIPVPKPVKIKNKGKWQ
ncbi:MAG: hypothetical protein GY941_21025 [Planctomycetes bacterium]|nr:hypothetical protein [Planctomycetota bacterium]